MRYVRKYSKICNNIHLLMFYSRFNCPNSRHAPQGSSQKERLLFSQPDQMGWPLPLFGQLFVISVSLDGITEVILLYLDNENVGSKLYKSIWSAQRGG